MRRAVGPRRRSTLVRKVGERLRSLRESRGLSISEVARRVGTSPAAIRLLETGERAATLVTIEAVSRALSVSVSGLFTGDRKGTEANADRTLARLHAALEGRPASQLTAIETLIQAFDQAIAIDRDEP